ncbi:MAG: hypothetical protein KTR14_01605 [Vampirovibrio sp.]|nr:hypothetical protein [Vampirovibrio sp.]
MKVFLPSTTNFPQAPFFSPKHTQTRRTVFSGSNQAIVPGSLLSSRLTQWPSAFAFKKVFEEQNSAYIQGKPLPLSTESLKKIDRLSRALRYLNGNYSTREPKGAARLMVPFPPFTVDLDDGKKVTIIQNGRGTVSNVYEFILGGKKYALKMYKDPERLDTHGSYSEIGAFTYLLNKPVKGIPELFFANPKEGWLLTSWYDEKSADKGKRTGLDLFTFLKHESMEHTNTGNENVGFSNFVYDLGGIHPVASSKLTSFLDFQKLLSSGHDKKAMNAGYRIPEIPDKAERKKALYSALDHPQLRSQVMKSAGLRTLKCLSNDDDIVDILGKGLNYPESAGRAIFYADGVAESDRYPLFVKALRYKNSLLEASKFIDKLPYETRLPSILKIFRSYPSGRALAARAISSLNEPDKQTAIKEGMKYPLSRFVINTLFNSSKKHEQWQAFHDYFREAGLDVKMVQAKSI